MTRPDLMPRAECDAVLAAAIQSTTDLTAPKRMGRPMAQQLQRALNRLVVLARRANPPIQSSRTTELFRAMQWTNCDCSASDRQLLRGYLRTAQTISTLVRWDEQGRAA